MPRAALSDQDVAAMRQRLGEAALALYKAEGEGAVTFRRLAREMGTSHTQPYRYFDGKADLFALVRLTCYRRFAAVIRDSDPVDAGPGRRLAAIHDAIMDYVRAEPVEYQLMFSAEQPPLEDYPALLSVRRQAFDYMVDIVHLAVDAGEMDGDARDVMHVAWSAVHGLLNLHTAGQLVHGRSLEDLVWPLLRTVLHPLFEDMPCAGRRRIA